MESAKGRLRDAAAIWRSRRERLRLECRECEVICERVVSPWRCLRTGCSSLYAYEDLDTTYFGCLHKVFLPELDLAPFVDAGGREARGADPYGPLRVSRSPRPECRTTVEQAYPSVPEPCGCCNPTFFHHPAAPYDEGIRLITNPFPGRAPDLGDS